MHVDSGMVIHVIVNCISNEYILNLNNLSDHFTIQMKRYVCFALWKES